MKQKTYTAKINFLYEKNVFCLKKKVVFPFETSILHHETGKVENAQNHRYTMGQVEVDRSKPMIWRHPLFTAEWCIQLFFAPGR